MGMNLHRFSLSECNLRQAKTPSTIIAAQTSQQSSCKSDVGQLGKYSAQQQPPGQPRTDKISQRWPRLSRAVAQSIRWLSRNAVRLLLPVDDPFCMRARFSKASDNLKKSPSDKTCIQEFLRFYELSNWLSTRVRLRSELSKLNNEAVFELMVAASTNPAWKSLAKATEAQLEKTSQGRLFLLFKHPSECKKWGDSFDKVWRDVGKYDAQKIFKTVCEGACPGKNSILFSTLYAINPYFLKFTLKLDKEVVERARNDLVTAFQSDPIDEALAKKSISILEIAGANHKADPEYCVLLPALIKMDNASIARLRIFVKSHCAHSLVMNRKIKIESSNRKLNFHSALKNEFRQSALLLRTAPLDEQLQVWNRINELSQSARFKDCNFAEAAQYILKSADIFTLVSVFKELPVHSKNAIWHEFRVAARNELQNEENLSGERWHSLLDKEMDEVGKFLEIKNANGDKVFEKLFAGWEREKIKRARLQSCKEVENALKIFLMQIDTGRDTLLKLHDIGILHEISSEDVQQILQRIVANTPREKLQHISSMKFFGQYEERLITEAKEQLESPRANLMDDKCLLAYIKCPNLSTQTTELLHVELVERSRLSHEGAMSALTAGLSDGSPQSWLYGLIVFLDQEHCAEIFDAATGNEHDNWNVINDKLSQFEQEINRPVKERLKIVAETLNAMQPEFGKIKSNEFQRQQFDRLCNGIKMIHSKIVFDSSVPETGDAANHCGTAIKSAALNYLGVPLSAVVMRRLTNYEKDFYKIQSRDHFFADQLRRPMIDSEGDLLLVCEQFQKDVARCSIVIDGKLLDRFSREDSKEISREFIQKLRLMQATDAQIMEISRLASQSTSNTYNELCENVGLYRLTNKEKNYIKGHEGKNLSLTPSQEPDILHVISRTEGGVIKVQAILTYNRLKVLRAGEFILHTDPDKTSLRGEFEFTVDKYGQMLPTVSILENFHREIIDGTDN